MPLEIHESLFEKAKWNIHDLLWAVPACALQHRDLRGCLKIVLGSSNNRKCHDTISLL